MASSRQAPSNGIFAEYIGAQFQGVTFENVPINLHVPCHLILAFAIDYTKSDHPAPTNGNFNVFWDSRNLSPAQVLAFKQKHPNVKVALSLGGDSVNGENNHVYFNPTSIDSWVSNAVSSLARIIDEYKLDGIDINYEHFMPRHTAETFSQCIGRLIGTLKRNGKIKFASIAPFNDGTVQTNYLALWRNHGHLIDYVNFQFYTYPRNTTVPQFIEYFNQQSKNYNGGRVLASFLSVVPHGVNYGGLHPDHGFFDACQQLKREKRLHGIFVWSADTSYARHTGFVNERRSQDILAAPN